MCVRESLRSSPCDGDCQKCQEDFKILRGPRRGQHYPYQYVNNAAANAPVVYPGTTDYQNAIELANRMAHNGASEYQIELATGL